MQFINLNCLCAFMHSLENISYSISNHNIWDSLHRNCIKNSIHSFAIKSRCLFLRSWPLAYRSNQFLSSVFNGVPNSLINRFQEFFYPYFPVGIVVPIKVRWDHKRVTVFHDNRDQGSTLRSKALKTQELTCSNTICTFLDPLNTSCLT